MCVKVFENKVLKKIFGHEKDEMSNLAHVLHNDDEH
jgi:hypothetical protein